MPTFVGFNTIGRARNFTLTDRDLVIRDLLNALNIQQGEVPGRPQVGTLIWSFLFENQTPETVANMLAEMQRVAGQDPRIFLQDANVYPQQNGILIELLVQIRPSTETELLNIFFNQQTRRASNI
jgi:phage baseplate assembly protein W